MQFHYPFYFDARQGGATDGDEDHVRDMIEQYLFTNPGERVNRPDFGSGLMQFVFGSNSPELAAALRFTLQAGMQRWLGDILELDDIQIEIEDERLTVLVEYTIRRTSERQVATFRRSVP